MADDATPFLITQAELAAAIIKLNSMCPDEGIIMTRTGCVRTGNSSDADFLCMLLPAPQLARQLTADGLSSYTGKELKKWAESYDLAPLQALADAARGS